MRLVYLAIATAAVLGGASAADADVVFTDGTFDLSNYTVSSPLNRLFLQGSTDQQCSACGNPGQALQLTQSLGSPSFGIYAQEFINNTFTFNPQTQGAISSIGVTVDQSTTATFGRISNFNLTHQFSTSNFADALLEQNGVFYIASLLGTTGVILNNPNSTSVTQDFGYMSVGAMNLTAANFSKYTISDNQSFPDVHPDFSGAGGAISFGLAQQSAFTNIPLTFAEEDFDNLTFDISTPVAVPEPPALIPLSSAMVLLGLMRRRRAPWSERHGSLAPRHFAQALKIPLRCVAVALQIDDLLQNLTLQTKGYLLLATANFVEKHSRGPA